MQAPLFSLVYHDGVVGMNQRGEPRLPHRFLLDLLCGRCCTYRMERTYAGGQSGDPLEWFAASYRASTQFARDTAFAEHVYRRFVNGNRAVQQPYFRDPDTGGTRRVIVNFGPGPVSVGGIELPAEGFYARSRTGVAYHATSIPHAQFGQPSWHTIRSLDGEPVRRSRRLELHRAYGDTRIHIASVHAKAKVVGEAWRGPDRRDGDTHVFSVPVPKLAIVELCD